jgi:hypothetical protein
MGVPGLDYYLARAAAAGPVGVHEGQSGYFSRPSNALDPRLFHGDHLRPEIRAWLAETLYSYWAQRYRNANFWSTVWLAGSGISYQWNADRGNGDLDVLVGVDWPLFFEANETYRGLSDTEMADQLNQELHRDLWPGTATTRIATEGPVNGPTKGLFFGDFEITFYVNATGSDIRDIHPYAAYDVSRDRWTVKPPVLPQDPRSLYPKEWWDYVEDERRLADALIQRYNHVQGATRTSVPGGAAWSSNGHNLQVVADQIGTLYDDIHLGRRAAFGQQGQGYGDFANFRWQAHKKFGTAQALHEVWAARHTGRTDYETDTYGQPLTNAQETLRAAALYARRYPQ